MDPLLEDLLRATRVTPRQVDESKIASAWQFAEAAHKNQLRLSGDPFITHPTIVAKTLALWNLDTTCIVAGLLHDTVEDCQVSIDRISQLFGSEVGQIVDGVTKITNIRLKGSVEAIFIENLRKMLLVMAKDLRVILVKLADRLHNMQTLQYLPPESQLENSRETLEVYAPLAERLGMGEIKGQLEDLAFPFVYPKEFQQLSVQIKPLVVSGQDYIEEFKKQLLSLIRPQIHNAAVNTRQKHMYSLFKKLQRSEIGNDLNKIYDLFAARVIVNTPEECYRVLGLVHGKFHPVPYLGLSDFIAVPKPNGYQSLHTKIFGPQGRIVELQIRTQAMHEQAEMGVAAHWQYSQDKSSGVSDRQLEKSGTVVSSKMSWVKELMRWQQEIADNDEYLKTLKFDALQHRLLVFSPKGDVYDLPAGSTSVDFAYAVHTDLGDHASAAKVNSRLVSLDYVLKNGDVVEIIVDHKRQTPNRDWLNFVVTATAKREISKTTKPGN
jgi:GTP pyrophosphokinase